MKRETLEAILTYLNEHAEPISPIVLGRPTSRSGVFAVVGEDAGYSYLGGKRQIKQKLLFLCRSDIGSEALAAAERIRAAADGTVVGGARLFVQPSRLLDREGTHITYAAELTAAAVEVE